MNAGLGFAFTGEQEMLRKVVHDFAVKELTPEWLRELDRTARAPHDEILPKMAALGFTSLVVPKQYGGLGGGCIDATVLLEELGRTSLSIASLLNFAIGFGTQTIISFGTEEQKRYYLPRVCTGDMFFAFSLTEPNAGSDAASIQTRAVAAGDDFVITGTKIFTTGAKESKCLLVATRTDPGVPKHRGISLFLVDSTTPGITYRPIEKLGMRGAGGLYEVQYENVRVPRSSLLGPLHGGWNIVKATLERVRLSQAAYCVGCSQQVIDDAVRYAQQREQFGQPIGKFQAISHLLAELHVQAESARWLLYRAAWLVDQGVRCVKEASIANLHATETLLRVTSDAMRVYGGYGFTLEFDIQRHMRDARLFVIGDGSSQIQRNLIARLMGL
ncbi:MAG: acyl-CoA dehydrogenase family protein [Candidatus Rokuibacteriota bacterium]